MLSTQVSALEQGLFWEVIDHMFKNSNYNHNTINKHVKKKKKITLIAVHVKMISMLEFPWTHKQEQLFE